MNTFTSCLYYVLYVKFESRSSIKIVQNGNFELKKFIFMQVIVSFKSIQYLRNII